MKDCRMSLVISFVLKLKGDERIEDMVYGHVSPLSSVWKYVDKWGQTWREMDECSDGMGKMISLFHIFLCFDWLV